MKLLEYWCRFELPDDILDELEWFKREDDDDDDDDEE